MSASTISNATYSWTGPNGFTSNQQNPTISSSTAAMTGDYKVTATVLGCTSGEGKTTVTVNAIPTITGTTPGNICVSGTTTLSATGSSGSTINWYDVSTGGTIRGTGNTFTTDNISSTRTYYVDATANSCTTPTRTAVVATVNAKPVITSATTNSFCNSGTVNFSATSTTGTINWYSASTGGTLVATGASFSTNLSSTTTYYVEATLNGCSSPRTAVTATKFTAKPSFSNGSKTSPTGPNSVCPGDGTVLTYTESAGVNNAEYYLWNLPPGFEITSGDKTNQITVNVPGPGALNQQYQPLSVSLVNACGTTTSDNLGGNGTKAGVSVGKFNAVDAGPDATICAGTSFTLTNNLSGAANTATWATPSWEQ